MPESHLQEVEAGGASGGHGSSKGGEAGEPGEFRDPRWQGKVRRCCQKLPVQTFVEPPIALPGT